MPYADEEVGKKYRQEYYLKHKDRIINQVKKYYKEHFEKRAIQKKKWADRNREKLVEYRKNYYAKYYRTKKGREILINASKKYRKNNRYKVLAHYAIRAAIRNGEITKPVYCSSCKSTILKIQGHHEDYSNPLDVIWLCHSCHVKLHCFKAK